MKGPLFYSKILLFGEYGIIKDSKGLSIPYNFYNGALKKDENLSESAIKSHKQALFELTNSSNTQELIKFGIKKGLIIA